MSNNEVDKLLDSTTKEHPFVTEPDVDPDVAPDLTLPSRLIESEFEDKYQNLKDDIESVDARMLHINKFIVNLETQVNNIRALIANDENPNKRGSYYTLMNTCIELNARYEELYLKCLDIKFKYRKEQGDLSYKVKKMSHIDIPRMKQGVKKDDGGGELSAGKLSSLLHKLNEKLNKTDSDTSDVLKSLTELETDEEYKI